MSFHRYSTINATMSVPLDSRKEYDYAPATKAPTGPDKSNNTVQSQTMTPAEFCRNCKPGTKSKSVDEIAVRSCGSIAFLHLEAGPNDASLEGDGIDKEHVLARMIQSMD